MVKERYMDNVSVKYKNCRDEKSMFVKQ